MNKKNIAHARAGKSAQIVLLAVGMLCGNALLAQAQATHDTVTPILQQDTCSTKASSKTNEPLMMIGKPAQFRGGQQALNQYLSENLEYPPEAMQNGIEGRIFCRFVVSEKGTVSDIQIIGNADPFLAKEAHRVVLKMPCWEPAEHEGKKVSSYMTLPFNFRLQK